MVASLSTPSVTSATAVSPKQVPDPNYRQQAKTDTATEADSTQVSISAEALRQAQQAQQSQQTPQAQQAQVASRDKPVDDGPEKQAAQAASAPPATPPSPREATSARTSSTVGRGSLPEAAYRPADANKDGLVSVLEQEAFDFEHPSLERPTDNSALKAYADVARGS